MPTESSRVCNTCGEGKPISSFINNSRKQDYYVGTCKECRLKAGVLKHAWPELNNGNSMQFNSEQGLFEMTLLNAESSKAEFDDVVVEGLKRGIPPEFMTRLKEIWEQTKVVAGEIVAVGKIIVLKIIEFLQANPKIAIGIAIGAAVSVLIAGIPLIGPFLAPLVLLFSTLYGAGVGAAMQKGDYSGSPFTAAIELANKFFELIGIIFNAVAQYWSIETVSQ